MRPHSVQSTPAIAILALAEIKASIERPLIAVT